MKQVVISFLSGILLLGSIGCKTTGNTSSTAFIFPVIVNPPPIKLQPHEGFVVLNNKDTLFGSITLERSQKKEDGITIKNAQEEKRFISYLNLQQVRLYSADTTVIQTAWTDFKRLDDKPRVWRQIADGKVAVYDESKFVDESIGDIGAEIMVADNEKMHYLWNFWHRDRKQDLLQFVNKRYGTKYTRRDYKTSLDLIQLVATRG